MREYGQVQSAFWQSSDAAAWSDTGKLLALYLLTGPHANGIGCYRLPNGYVMADLGWDTETVSKGLQELSASGFAYRFNDVVFLPNFLRWNRIANGNIAKARFAEFSALPKGEAKTRVARAMLEFSDFWTAEDQTVLETISETLPEGYANQNQTQPNQTKPNTRHRADDGRTDRFDQFWSTYPRHQGKKAAAKAFAKVAPDDELLEVMLAAVARQRTCDQWQRDGGQFVPHAATWLNGRRWEDEAPPTAQGGQHASASSPASANSDHVLRRAI
ncbi:hypothetical protein [Dyella nitratireducens]|uniref:Replication protein n=1 Tax=Dyella nitratireducens TaxID=1849580 RepID=A0ABQ1FRZ1_9GAMM|nr:hypothetical protein [Dyella nitratireducens]GGA28678.1 hypothetical protein GCM10010981_16860 [Dyella nitratireducens]GLQ43249.1 hypothetical protein GCM10007902_30990 [Dyella nitratireducens]